MEKIKIKQLKDNIEKAKEKTSNPIYLNHLETIKFAIKHCPPKYLRITKMNYVVNHILENKEESDNALL